MIVADYKVFGAIKDLHSYVLPSDELVILWVELSPSKRYIKSYPLGTCECDFIGNRVFADVIKLR